MAAANHSNQLDRLSDLPDDILHHILSFLDTKSLVQTCTLSRRWRCCWKHVPLLNFRPVPCPNSSRSFRKQVDELLNARFHSIPVRTITFDVRQDWWIDRWIEINRRKDILLAMIRIMDECVPSSSDWLSPPDDEEAAACVEEMVDAVVAADQHQESLETLKMGGCRLGTEFCRFHQVTTLELSECRLENYASVKPFDPFAAFHRLKYLKLIRARSSMAVIVSGRELLEIEIERPDFYRGYEVIAPKLESFCFSDFFVYKRDLPGLNLPALDRANVGLQLCRPSGQWNYENREVVMFLRGLCNAESLKLCLDKQWNGDGDEDEEQHLVPLDRMNALMEEHEDDPLPFKRLRSLRIQCSYRQEWPSNIRHQVIRHFFKGSNNVEEKFVQHYKIVDYYRRD